MSILIRGMEMPKSCFYCPFREKVNPDDYVCIALNEEFEETFSLIAGKRYSNCPLVPVPEHGRLIDADALAGQMQRNLFEIEDKAEKELGFDETLRRGMNNYEYYTPEFCDGHYCCRDCERCPIADKIIEAEAEDEVP